MNSKKTQRFAIGGVVAAFMLMLGTILVVPASADANGQMSRDEYWGINEGQRQAVIQDACNCSPIDQHPFGDDINGNPQKIVLYDANNSTFVADVDQTEVKYHQVGDFWRAYEWKARCNQTDCTLDFFG